MIYNNAQSNRLEDRTDFRAESTSVICIFYIICGVLIAVHFLPVPGIILLISGLLSFRFRKDYTEFVNFTLLATAWLTLGLQQIFLGFQPSFQYLAVFPALIGIVLVRRERILLVALLSSLLIFSFDGVANKTLWLSMDSLIASFLAVVAGICGYVVTNEAYLSIQWAIDNQNKSHIRAESFYEQGEALRKSLHDLERANIQLQQLTVELDLARQTVETTSQAKSLFLSNMSHELRTPLNMIIGYTNAMLHLPQMYQQQSLPTIFQGDIELILSSGQYLLTMINDILDLSKIESGKFEIRPTVFNLTSMLQGVMAIAVGLVQDKNLQLKPDYPDEDLLVWGDPLRIRQILLNLMSNGIKYCVTGSVTLSVQVHPNKIAIAVIDTGIGIPKDTISHLFGRFEQIRHDPNIQGTGLGLDISQRLAQLHGTEIRVESTLGVGSTFSFELRLPSSEELASHAIEGETTEIGGIKWFENSEETWETRHTVLIAEDDSATRALLTRIFEAEKYVVFAVQDGNQVYETASALLPSLIILDILLPNKEGWEILQELRNDAETANIPVIVLTAFTGLAPELRARANEFLEKPVNVGKLLEVSKALLKSEAS